MERITDEIKKLSETETAWAIRNHGYYHSLHEGYGVLVEEMDETNSEAGELWISIQNFWESIKQDDPESAIEYAEEARELAIRAAAEMVQVSAVLQKIIESEGEDGKVYWIKSRETRERLNRE